MADTGEPGVLDDEAWASGERFWRELVDEILVSLGQAGEWPASEPRFYGDGVTPIPREDLSICDGRSWTLDRSFSIQQFPATDVAPGISAEVKDWAAGLLDFSDISDEDDVNRFFEQGDPKNRVPRSTLYIRLEISEATTNAARALLGRWLIPETTVADMVGFIDETPDVDRYW